MSARPSANQRSPAWRRNRKRISADAATATPMKNARCQPPASARKLNAAPVL
jgi:hypothetical protein